MKHTLLLLFIACSFFQSKQSIAQVTKKAAENIVGVFDGRTPCQLLAKQLKEKTTTDV